MRDHRRSSRVAIGMSILALVMSAPGWAIAAELDTTFGDRGVSVIETETGSNVFAVAQLADGVIAVGGGKGNDPLTPWLELVAADGSASEPIDMTALADVVDIIWAITELGGDLLLVGSKQHSNLTCDWVLARIDRTGTFDAAFGQTGPGYTAFPDCGPGVVADFRVIGDRIELSGFIVESPADEVGDQLISFDLEGGDLQRFGSHTIGIADNALGRVGADYDVMIREDESPLLFTTTRADLDAHLDDIGIERRVITSQPVSNRRGSVVVVSEDHVLLDLVVVGADGSVTSTPARDLRATPVIPFYSAVTRTGEILSVAVTNEAAFDWVVDVFDQNGSLIDEAATWSDGDIGPAVAPQGLVIDDSAGTAIMVADSNRFPAEDAPVAIIRLLTDRSGRFVDDDTSVHETDIAALAAAGITRGCNPPVSTRFCPDATVSRAEMASFLVRAADLAPTVDAPFTDTQGSVHAADIATLAAAGITRGCNPPDNDRYCPDGEVTRGQMASFLVRAFGLAPATDSPFTDTQGSVYAADIAALAAAGITAGCTADRYCPENPVTRAQMASFLVRAMWSG